MSSTPYPEGVKKLRYCANRYRKLNGEVGELQEKIEKLQTRLKDAIIERGNEHQYLLGHLSEMDCAASGNAGWENRIAWMLGELEYQSRTTECDG